MRTRATPFLLGFAALGLACTGIADSGWDTAGETGTQPVGECGPIVGEAGAFAKKSTTFDWTWSDEIGVWVGPTIERTVPEDITSLGVTIDDGSAWTGFVSFSYAGVEMADAWNEGGQGGWDGPPLFHYPAEAGTIVLPINPQSDPAGGGCLSFQPMAWDDPGPNGAMHIVSRRGDAGEQIDLNFIIVGDTEIYQDEMDEVLERANDVWTGGGGPKIGTVNYYTLEGSAYIDGDTRGEILATKVSDDPQAVNIFLIADFSGSDWAGTLGIAAGIPGPVAVHGTWGSGVVVGVESHLDYDGTTLDTQTMGETVAHEVGHQLGLFHTTEADGTRYDILDDTPDCPTSADTDNDGQLSATECQSWDGANFMFWVAGIPQNEMSDAQADVLNLSPVTR